MKSFLRQFLSKIELNAKGKAVGDKVVIFESDDWGSIRIEGEERRNKLFQAGLIGANDPFSNYDALEKEEDFDHLFEILRSFENKEGTKPTFTLNTIMANPDFKRIKESYFQDFISMPLEQTYMHFHSSTTTMAKWFEGMSEKLITPQFHGLVHVNVHMWMKKLQERDPRFLEAFDLECFAIDEKQASSRGNLMATYEYENEEELAWIKKNIEKGLKAFERTFGFKSKSTIAPCYVWDDAIEKIFAKGEVSLLQGSKYQMVPQKRNFSKKRNPILGTNALGQTYGVRNVLFEPATDKNLDWVDRCLQSIQIAFLFNRPAVIGTHRINYTSGLSVQNRDRSLKLLEQLLKGITKKWPEVKFASSDELFHFL